MDPFVDPGRKLNNYSDSKILLSLCSLGHGQVLCIPRFFLASISKSGNSSLLLIFLTDQNMFSWIRDSGTCSVVVRRSSAFSQHRRLWAVQSNRATESWRPRLLARFHLFAGSATRIAACLLARRIIRCNIRLRFGRRFQAGCNPLDYASSARPGIRQASAILNQPSNWASSLRCHFRSKKGYGAKCRQVQTDWFG